MTQSARAARRRRLPQSRTISSSACLIGIAVTATSPPRSGRLSFRTAEMALASVAPRAEAKVAASIPRSVAWVASLPVLHQKKKRLERNRKSRHLRHPRHPSGLEPATGSAYHPAVTRRQQPAGPAALLGDAAGHRRQLDPDSGRRAQQWTRCSGCLMRRSSRVWKR